MNIVTKIRFFFSAIRFEHTLFALPFAYIGMVLAANGLPTLHQFVWITVAMASARTVAMTANRLVHAKEDALNPRTSSRHIPQGLLKPKELTVAMLLSIGVFIFAAYQLNTLAFVLSPFVVAILFLYTYAKYFTWSSHFVLGWSDAIAPAGAWIGVQGHLDFEGFVLALAVASWVAGFDIIYSCMDYEFDKGHGIHSIPRKFGIAGALWWTRGLHCVTAIGLLSVGLLMDMGFIYYSGWAIACMVLAYQNSIVRPSDLSRVRFASLQLNSVVGTLLLTTSILDVTL